MIYQMISFLALRVKRITLQHNLPFIRMVKVKISCSHHEGI